MKKILLVVISVLGIVSCSKQESFNDKALKAVTPYVEGQTGVDLKMKGNTLRVISIDTLTEKDRLLFKAREKYEILKLGDGGLIKIQEQKVKELNELYNRYPIDKVRKELESAFKEYNEIKERMVPFVKEIEAIGKKQEVADSVAFKAYKVTTLLNFITKENIAKVDTVFVIMNDKLNVIENGDFLRN